ADEGLLLAALEFGVGAPGAEAVVDVGAQGLGPVGGEGDRGVAVLDEDLDLFDAHGGLVTSGALLMAADAQEVPVGGPVAVLGLGADQAALAAAAVDGALEVVVVGPLLLAGGVLCVEHSLDPVPGLDADERLVGAWVVDAAVADVALVVGVVEQPMELRD